VLRGRNRRLASGTSWLVVVLVGMLALAASAGAAPPAQPQTTVTEIEGEVMCPICGTLLELSDSPQARREKVYVAKLVAAGKTKAEIKDALVAQYGSEVLALPRGSGFDLTAYLVPVLALLVAIVAIALAVVRWRRDGTRAQETSTVASGPRGEDAERLDADIARYDL
jgi:cytochrome c-type biogenesis protein CcmH